MSTDPYSARVRALFAKPAHSGLVQHGQTVRLEEQDVRLELSAAVADGVVAAMRFRAWGCPHLIAAAEAVCEGLEGRSVAELLEFSSAALMESLAVPVEKTGRILVLEDAVRALGQQFGDGP